MTEARRREQDCAAWWKLHDELKIPEIEMTTLLWIVGPERGDFAGDPWKVVSIGVYVCNSRRSEVEGESWVDTFMGEVHAEFVAMGTCSDNCVERFLELDIGLWEPRSKGLCIIYHRLEDNTSTDKSLTETKGT